MPNIVFVQPLVDLVSSLASIYIKGIQNHLSRWTIIHLFWLIICWFWMPCTWSKTYTNLVMVIMFIYSIYTYLPMSVALKCTYIHVFALKLSRVITRLRYIVDYPWSYWKSELMVYVTLRELSVCSVNWNIRYVVLWVELFWRSWSAVIWSHLLSHWYVLLSLEMGIILRSSFWGLCVIFM